MVVFWIHSLITLVSVVASPPLITNFGNGDLSFRTSSVAILPCYVPIGGEELVVPMAGQA